MQSPSRVIYLPPGVMPPAAPPQVAQPIQIPGAPFDRAFFEQILPGAVQSFCSQAKCESPVVELLTVDGTTHFIKGISGVTDIWVALHTTAPEHDHDIQVFIPYQTIFRVAVHPCDQERRRLGFILEPKRMVQALGAAPAMAAVVSEPAVEAKAARSGPKARAKGAAKA